MTENGDGSDDDAPPTLDSLALHESGGVSYVDSSAAGRRTASGGGGRVVAAAGGERGHGGGGGPSVVSSMTRPRQSILRANLSVGFASLAAARQDRRGGGGGSKRNVISPSPSPTREKRRSAQSQDRVTVNFIDPTTAASAASRSAAKQRSGGGGGGGLAPTLHAQSSLRNLTDLYGRLTETFERDYGSLLHGVPYEDPRSGRKGSIERLPVRTVLTGGGGGGGNDDGGDGGDFDDDDSNNNNGGGRGGNGGAAAAPISGTAPVSDPAEWHTGPYCHVYLAMAESLEHYRAKVRPALRAFVSQVEGSIGGGSDRDGSGSVGGVGGGGGGRDGRKKKGEGREEREMREAVSAATSAELGGRKSNFSKQYLIVYVPSGGGDGGTERSSGGAFGGFRAGRRVTTSREASDESSTHGGDDGTGVGNGPGGRTGGDALAAAPPPGPIAHSSKSERELFHKFQKDFPRGRTVLLSTLLESNPVGATSPLKNQEWNAFLRGLGDAIAAGFRDRAKRYDEELRRLEKPRGGGAGSSVAAGVGHAQRGFDLSSFFLVKESLAFTYEQMRLYDEALLQYEELGAFVPDATCGGRRNSDLDAGVEDEEGGDGPTSADLAAAGDTARFRRKIRSTADFRRFAPLVLQYLFARETHLLFRLENPVEVVRRSRGFVKLLYRMRLPAGGAERHGAFDDGIAATTRRRRAEAEAWALATCWDVKCACDGFLSFDTSQLPPPPPPSSTPRDPAAMSPPGYSPNLAEGGGGAHSLARSASEAADLERERDAARELGDLLEFARLRLVRLGDLELTYDNPIRLAASERPADTLRPWVPWEELHATKKGRRDSGLGGLPEDQSGGPGPDARDEGPPASLDNLRIDDQVIVDGAANAVAGTVHSRTGISQKFLTTWLRTAFSSREAFEKKYLELTDAIVVLNRHAGRHRFASRLQGEQAEILIFRGEFSAAATILLGIVDACARDHWDQAHYWRVFRLAYCQRMAGDPHAYLETLRACFNPRLSLVAPRKTSNLLQRDLESLVAEVAISDTRWGISPFLETELSVEPTASGKSSCPLGYLRKKAIKYACLVGETMKIGLRITSHLLRSIVVHGIKLYLVTFDRYESVHRSTGVVTEEDAFRVLSLDAPITINPGQNIFEFEWTPMTVEQYVLATVEIQWKEASFFYDSSLLRRPITSIDVLPSEPTQTIELNPLFLMPGHVQNVRLVFHSGSDIVTDGTIKFLCSEGLKVIPPGIDPNANGDAWQDSCSVPLEPCGPDSKIVLTTSVKSEVTKRGDGAESMLRPYQQQSVEGPVQTLHTKVVTSYRHSLYNDVIANEEEPESIPMTTLLEAMVTTLDRPAFTVDQADAFFFGEECVMVNVALHCNTPVPFFLKEWEIELPAPLAVEDNGDLNGGLFQHAISEGEELFFGFKCTRTEIASSVKRPILHVVLQDDFGKTFRQVFPLDLDKFYEQIRIEDEYANMNTATAKLDSISNEGVVGGPVKFSYHLDVGALTAQKRRRSSMGVTHTGIPPPPSLHYSISCEAGEWILGGKVMGVLDISSGAKTFDLDFVGIPTMSGVLKCFPVISLWYQSSSGLVPAHNCVSKTSSQALPPISVQLQHPEYFKSLSYTNHMALACPSVIEG